jgi:hypothetical protein
LSIVPWTVALPVGGGQSKSRMAHVGVISDVQMAGIPPSEIRRYAHIVAT